MRVRAANQQKNVCGFLLQSTFTPAVNGWNGSLLKRKNVQNYKSVLYPVNALRTQPSRFISRLTLAEDLWLKTFITVVHQYTCVIDQAWGQDGWILAKYFFCFVFCRGPQNAKKRTRLISSHLDRTSLVNKRIIWLYCQFNTTKNPKQNMKLLCSERNSLQPAGIRFIFSASSFGLVDNHEKMGILNYHKDLVLQWLKGIKQLLCT